MHIVASHNEHSNVTSRVWFRDMKTRFKQIRAHYGLSQAQFAQKLNMSPGFISNVETGRSDISDATVHSICEAFNVNEEWLRNGSGEMLSAAPPPANKETAGGRVKTVRKRERLTQQQFADRIGYSKMQVLFVEKGTVTPSNSFLEKIAAVFAVSYDWLLSGEGDVDADPGKLDEELIAWLRKHPEVVREIRERRNQLSISGCDHSISGCDS